MSLLKNATDNIELGRNLTHEMIHTQTDIVFTTELEKEIQFIKTEVNKEDIRSSKNFFKNALATKSLKSIGDILSKRFGFEINFIFEEGAGLCTIPVYPSEYNIVTDIAKYYQGEYRYKSKSDTVMSPKDIKDFKESSDHVYQNIYKAFDSLNKKLAKENVVIDLKKAKIHNLPKEYNIFIIADIAYALHEKGLKWTASELVAGILHEVGHSFTLFEKSIYTVKNTILLMDTIKEQLNNKNNNTDDIINITYKKISNKTSVDNTLNTSAALTEFLNGYSFVDDKFEQNSRISAEQQADQFASRFGYGKELVTLISSYGDNYRLKTTFEVLLEGGNIGGLILVLAGVIINPGGTIAFMAVLFLIEILGLRNYNKLWKQYDTDLRRYLRIKQDAIRQLRLYNKKDVINQAMYKRLEDTILLITTKVEIMSNMNNRNFLNKFVDKIESDVNTKKVVNMLEISESLMENDLHYLNLKLKEKA